MTDLSVIIPARNEQFLQRTIEDVLEHAEADTEVIAIADGYWPDPPIQDHPKVTLVHHSESIGQRAATNEGARISRAEYIMKLDGHCRMAQGFDVALMEDCRESWTMVPQMHNLHAFNWKCGACGRTFYQGKRPEACKCGGTEFEQVMVWKRRSGVLTICWRFDKDLHFQYWQERDKAIKKTDEMLVETMSCIGACFLMRRERFWELGGMDEAHGSWGQFGTELACKTWLSGGKMITSRKTWFAHLFRTENFKGAFGGGSSFPYRMSQRDVDKARKYSRDLWLNDKWPGAHLPLEWLIERFDPPGWRAYDDIKLD